MQKHPPDAYTPPGLEWWILRRLPKVSLAVTLAFGLGWWLIRIWPRQGSDTEIASQTLLAEYALLGGFIFFITMVVTVSIGCGLCLFSKAHAILQTLTLLTTKKSPGRTPGVSAKRQEDVEYLSVEGPNTTTTRTQYEPCPPR